MEDQGVARAGIGSQPAEALKHVGLGGPLRGAALVIGQHPEVRVLELEAALQQEHHALGVVDAAVQGAAGAPTTHQQNMKSCSSFHHSSAETHSLDAVLYVGCRVIDMCSSW